MRLALLAAAAASVVFTAAPSAALGAAPVATSASAAQEPASPRWPVPAAVDLASGVSYVEIERGEGAAVGRGARVTLHYRLSLADGSPVADTRRDRRPLVLRLGADQAVRGLEEGLLGMRVGGRRRIEVPAAHGYGRRTLPGIPAGSDLIFVVDLLAVD